MTGKNDAGHPRDDEQLLASVCRAHANGEPVPVEIGIDDLDASRQRKRNRGAFLQFGGRSGRAVDNGGEHRHNADEHDPDRNREKSHHLSPHPFGGGVEGRLDRVVLVRHRHSSSEDLISSVDTGDGEDEATRLVVSGTDAGSRLDRFLAQSLGGTFSRARLQALIADGQVLVGGIAVAQASRKVAAGDTIEIALPDPVAPDPEPEDIALSVLFEDEHLIVLDKPAGLVVHPGPGNWTGTLVNALLHHCAGSLSGIGGVKRPGIVHRLDRNTSGVMVVAKTDIAHRALAEQFAAHGRDGRMERAYLALVWGGPDRPRGTIEAALGRSNSDRTKRAVVPADRGDARHAVTHYESLRRSDRSETSLLRCRLETGRTHQIRVHLAHIGHPIVGDDVYGAGFRSKIRSLEEPARALAERFTRQALHAAVLGFIHPVGGGRLSFETPMPEDMAELVDALLH